MRTSPLGAALAAVAVALTGCAGGAVGSSGADEQALVDDVGTITVVSGDSQATVEPLCVDDIPEDYTACAGAPQNLGRIELDETRKLTVTVPPEVAESDYEIRVNDVPITGVDGDVDDASEAVRIPREIIAQPGPTVLTIEALTGILHPKAIWQVLVSDPAGITEDESVGVG